MKKRSKYRPRPVMRDTMHWVKSGFYKVDGHPATADLALSNHTAMDVLRKGKATMVDMKVLTDMLNVMEALTRVNQAFGEDYSQEIEAAQQAIMSLVARCKERGVFTCTASELDALRVAIELHDAQLEIATVNDIAQAMDIIKSVVGSGNATHL
jgi:hypothetical protein